MEKIVKQMTTKAFNFKVCLPRPSLVALYDMMRGMGEYRDRMSEIINTDLLSCKMVRGREDEVPLFKCIYESDKQEIRNWLDWEGHTEREALEACKKLGIGVLSYKDPFSKCNEDLAAKYQGRTTRIMKSLKAKGEELSAERIYEGMIVGEMMKLKPGASLEDKLLRNTKHKKQGKKWEPVYKYYLKTKDGIERDGNVYTYDNLFTDHVISLVGELKLGQPVGMELDEYFKKKSVTNRGLEEVRRLWDSPAAQESYKEALHAKALGMYIECGYRYKFAEYMKERNAEKKSHVIELVTGYFEENRETIEREFDEHVKKVFKDLQEKGGIKYSEPMIQVVNKDNLVQRVKDIPQFKEAGITSINGCEYVLNVKLICDEKEMVYKHESFENLFDRQSGKCYDLLNHSEKRKKGYVFIPINVSPDDGRDFDADALIERCGQQVTIKEVETRKGKKLFAYLTIDTEVTKPVNRFEKVVGIDVNSKHALFSCSERDIMESPLYIDLPMEVYLHYSRQGSIQRIVELDKAINLGQMSGERGHHATFGLLDNLLDSYDENDNPVQRFARKEDGTYYARRDAYSDAFKELLKVHCGDTPVERVKRNYISSCKSIRNNLTRLQCIDLEKMERQKAYDEAHDKAYKEKYPFANTETGKVLTKKRQKLKDEINENEKQIISYMETIFRDMGYDAQALENMTYGSWGKRTHLLSPKYFHKACIHESIEKGIPLTETKHFKDNKRFFDFSLDNFTVDEIRLNRDGEYENNKRGMLNRQNKNISLSSLKDMVSVISEKYGIQTHFVNPAYTSQIDSVTGYLPEEDEDGTYKEKVRGKQETFIHQDKTMSSADENAAKNIAMQVTDETLRGSLLQLNPDFPEKYGSTQYIPKKLSRDNVRKIYAERYKNTAENIVVSTVELPHCRIQKTNRNHAE